MRRRRRCVLPVSVLAVCAAVLVGCSSAGPSAEELAAEVGPAVEDYMAAADPHGQVRAVLVHRGGEPVVERYVVVSTLVGIAVADGHIEGVEATLATCCPRVRRR